MQRAEFRHRLELPLLWGHMDSFGHLNNVQFLRYIESGRLAYFETLTGAPPKPDQNIVLADIQCTFRQQLRYPCELEILSRVSRLGRTSIELLCAVYARGADEPAATSRAVLVWFDFIAGHPVPVPAHLREAIAAYEPVPPAG